MASRIRCERNQALFGGDTENAVQLVATEPFFAAGNRVHRLQPDMGGDIAGFHDGLHFDRKRSSDALV